MALGGVMGDFMAQGRSVKLDGVGSFYFTAVTVANGVATEKEVTVNQIKGCACALYSRNPLSRFRQGSCVYTRTVFCGGRWRPGVLGALETLDALGG